MNDKVFNLIKQLNETRHIVWHETCKCICRLTASVCNNRQRWNDLKCRCKCKKLVEKGIYDKRSLFNPSTCECECDRSCSIGEYLDYKSCVGRKTLVDKLVEECTSVIDENKVYNGALSTISSDDCASCTLYVALFALFLKTSVVIDSGFVYYWYLKKKNDQLSPEKNNVRIKFNPHTLLNIYNENT